MSQIGCKSCGRRKKRDLVNEVHIFEPSPSPSYVIKTESSNNSNSTEFDWKSMSKVI